MLVPFRIMRIRSNVRRNKKSSPRIEENEQWNLSSRGRLSSVLTAGLLLVGSLMLAIAQMEVTFLGNNGVMLRAGQQSVVIDALQNHGNTFWTRLPQAELRKLRDGTAPYEGIRYALATHNHPDHYSKAAVVAFLRNNPDAEFIGSEQIRRNLGERPQSLEILPEFQNRSVIVSEVPGISIEVFHMEHFDQFGNNFSSVQDFTYLVTMGGVSVLHLGDVDYTVENFASHNFNERKIDALILPTFNTLLSEANRDVILEQINPDHIIATHLRAGSLASDIENALRLYPNSTLFTEALQTLSLTPGAGSGLRLSVSILPAGGLHLDWIGGIPPFQLQRSEEPGASDWRDVGEVISEREMIVETVGNHGFFRILSGPPAISVP